MVNSPQGLPGRWEQREAPARPGG